MSTTSFHGISILEENPEKIFEVLENLGVGTFGNVIKARNIQTNELVAIKQLVVQEDEMEVVRREIKILQDCIHPNIVRYCGTYLTMNTLWIAMEYCEGGSVEDAFEYFQQPFPERILATICREVLKGLMYLHTEHKILHRDIKGGNILLTASGEVRLGDFGVSAELKHSFSQRNSFIGTLLYMAPEAIREQNYDWRADMWSLGITLLEMAEGKPPRHNVPTANLIYTIPRESPPTLKNPERWSPSMQHFLHQILQKDPLQRPSAKALLQKDLFLSEAHCASREEVCDMVGRLMELKREAKHSRTTAAALVEGSNRRRSETRSRRPLNDSTGGGMPNANPPFPSEGSDTFVQVASHRSPSSRRGARSNGSTSSSDSRDSSPSNHQERAGRGNLNAPSVTSLASASTLLGHGLPMLSTNDFGLDELGYREGLVWYEGGAQPVSTAIADGVVHRLFDAAKVAAFTGLPMDDWTYHDAEGLNANASAASGLVGLGSPSAGREPSGSQTAGVLKTPIMKTLGSAAGEAPSAPLGGEGRGFWRWEGSPGTVGPALPLGSDGRRSTLEVHETFGAASSSWQHRLAPWSRFPTTQQMMEHLQGPAAGGAEPAGPSRVGMPQFTLTQNLQRSYHWHAEVLQGQHTVKPTKLELKSAAAMERKLAYIFQAMFS